MLHSINECVKLTGKSRMTLYRQMTGGKLSYSVGRDERRRIETSELIRVFGELNDVDRADSLQDEIVNLKREVKLLHHEIRQLKTAIEYRPETPSIVNALRKRVASYLLRGIT